MEIAFGVDMILNGKQYKLVYLDTNVLRAITDNENGFGKYFFKHYFLNQDDRAPCFAFANVCEIKPYKDIFQKFMDMFSLIPHLMFYHYRILVREEFNAYKQSQKYSLNNQVMRAFIPIGRRDEDNFRKFISKIYSSGELSRILENEKTELNSIVVDWEASRTKNQTMFTAAGIVKEKALERLYLSFEKETVIKDLAVEGLSLDRDADYENFPSLRMVEYSLFQRQYLTKKPLEINDVMDIRMSAFIPYVDEVITEGFQANVYKKAQNHIVELKGLEIHTLKDFRNK